MLAKDIKLTTVKIQNYKSLTDLTIRLNKGLNIIIGKSGAGKSNFLGFLYWQLSRGIQADYIKLIAPREQTFQGAFGYAFDIEYQLSKDHYFLQIDSQPATVTKVRQDGNIGRSMRFSKLKNGKLVFKGIAPTRDANKNREVGIEMLNVCSALEVAFIGFNIPERLKYISAPGELSIEEPQILAVEEGMPVYNEFSTSALFGNELDKLVKESKSARNKKAPISKEDVLSWFEMRKHENNYIADIKRYSPIQDLRLNKNINAYRVDYGTILSNIVLEFKIDGLWIPWSHLPDGIRRMFYIITETVFGDRSIILMEEPELGIHPSQLYDLLYFLKDQAEEKQIILSTHSPISLDILKVEELDQIIITKKTKKGTKMYHLTDKQKEKATAYIKEVDSLSDYWLHSDLEK